MFAFSDLRQEARQSVHRRSPGGALLSVVSQPTVWAEGIRICFRGGDDALHGYGALQERGARVSISWDCVMLQVSKAVVLLVVNKVTF